MEYVHSFLMMRSACAVLLLLCCGGWAFAGDDNAIVEELKGRGFDIGGGLIVHLDSVEAPPANASIFERHALRFDYGGVGLRFGKAEDQDALKIGIYYDEGRGKKNTLSEMVFPALLGYKTTTIVAMGMAFVGMMVMKALMVANAALMAAAALAMMKYFYKPKDSKYTYTNTVELDHDPSEYHSLYADYGGEFSETGGYSPSASSQVLAYSAQAHDTGFLPSSSVAQPQYAAYVDVPLNNTSGALQVVQKRRDFKKAQPVQAYITIKRKSTVRD